jgi:hypothetical protein
MPLSDTKHEAIVECLNISDKARIASVLNLWLKKQPIL